MSLVRLCFDLACHTSSTKACIVTAVHAVTCSVPLVLDLACLTSSTKACLVRACTAVTCSVALVLCSLPAVAKRQSIPILVLATPVAAESPTDWCRVHVHMILQQAASQ